jgi:hypothetical protein
MNKGENEQGALRKFGVECLVFSVSKVTATQPNHHTRVFRCRDAVFLCLFLLEHFTH